MLTVLICSSCLPPVRRLAIAYMLLFPLYGFSAQIAFQGFENNPSDTWSMSGGQDGISSAIGTSDFPPFQRIRTGTHSWQVSNATDTLELETISTVGYSDVVITLHLSSPAGTTVQGTELTDSVSIFAALNGGGFPAGSDIRITGSSNNNAQWGYNAVLVANAAAGSHAIFSSPQEGNSTNNYATATIGLPAGTSSVALRIVARNTDVNERWCIDDIEISGTSGSYISQPPTPLTLTTPFGIPSEMSFDVHFSGLTDSLLATLSGSGAAGFAVDPDGIPASAPSPASFTVTYTPANIGIDSAILTFSSIGVTSRDVVLYGYALAMEPISQPTNLFFDNLTSTGFTVSFQASVPPVTGYLVLRRQGSEVSSFPGDGQTYAIGQYIGDAMVASVGPGTNFDEAGLFPSTTYYYSIFAYNGTGATLNYLNASPLQGSTTTIPGSTTETIFPGLRGQQLIDSLIAGYKTSTVLGYDNARDKMFGEIDNHDDSVTCVYTGDRIFVDHNSSDPKGDAYALGFNTEHTWPQSLGATGNAKSDLHHLYPTREDANGSRGNLPFKDIPDPETDIWYRMNYNQTSIPTQFIDEYSEYDNVGFFEPREDHKGNVARSIYYFYTMYKAQSDTTFFHLQKYTLRRWNAVDPVDSAELRRDDRIAAYQSGKKNPFILDTSLIGRAYFETIVGLDESEDHKTTVTLQSNYPNPFNPGTTISYRLDRRAPITLQIYNVLGQSIRHLVAQNQGPGTFEVYWDAKDDRGKTVTSGVYFYVLEVGAARRIGRMTLLK